MPKPSATFYRRNKKFFSFLLLFGLGLTSLARAERIFPAQVSKIIKDTPIFKEPSKTAESLGDAPANTPILLRGYSPKKTWVLVEDEDGAQGWVPTARVEVPLPEVMDEDTGAPLPGPAPEKNTAEKNAEAAPKTELFQPDKTYDVQFVGRYESKKGDSLGLLGALVSLSLYRTFKGGGSRFSRSEISVGYLRTPTHRDAWNVPLRYSIQNTDLASSFLMGPDVSFTFAKRDAGSPEKYFGIGYFFGYKLNQFSNARLRASYDLGKVSHFGFEGGMQWMFY